jgi:hypothetical protein
MHGKPFQSKLEPHFDFILEARRNRQTWEAIAQQLAAQGITTTKQAVHAFLRRRLKRRYPLGMAPAEKRPTAVMPPRAEKPTVELSEFTESLPPASDFDSDPLTSPPTGRTKPKSKWAVLNPNP